MKFTIALAQINNTLGDLRKNISKHVEVIRKAKEGGADLVVFPELSLSGYSIRDMNWDVAIPSSNPTPLEPILRESQDIGIILGSVEESPEYGIHNAALFLEKGIIHSIHRKVYPPTYGMFEEQRYFSPGHSVKAFNASVGRLGMLVCEDLWHLALPYVLAQDGAQVIITITASPTRLSGTEALRIAEVNYEQHRAYARLLSSYLVFCNRVGFEDGVSFWGGSAVVGPMGESIVRAKYFEEDLVFCEIDGNEVRRARRFSRHFLDDDVRLVMEELQRIHSKKNSADETSSAG